MKKKHEKIIIKRIKDAIRKNDLVEKLIQEMEEPADKDIHGMNYDKKRYSRGRNT